MTDQQKCAHALAKAFAYKACGKDEEAETWAEELCHLLGNLFLRKTGDQA